MGVSSVGPLSFGSQTPLVVPLRLPLMEPSGKTITALISLVRQLTTVKGRSDAARRNLTADTAELFKVSDENDEPHSYLTAFRETFLVSYVLLVDSLSKYDSAFTQFQLTDDVDEELS